MSFGLNESNFAAVMMLIFLCCRCIFTNIDPVTAERDPDGQPLKTLKTYRTFQKTGESPVMGVHLGVKVPGFVKLGDPVYVECK